MIGFSIVILNSERRNERDITMVNQRKFPKFSYIQYESSTPADLYNEEKIYKNK
jgi:hypothetical protein